VSLLPLSRIPGLGRIEARESDTPAPRRLVLALQELGPTFVKLGQVLSTRPDLLPPDYIEELTTLQDRVAPFDGAEARAVVGRALGADVDDLFEAFSTEAVASASMAQVHRARLAGGQSVAVKVQRPGIEQTLRSDLNILYALADLLEGQLDFGVTTPAAVVQAFDRAISREVDFREEADNAERFAAAMAGIDGVAVPKVWRRLSTREVLTLEWVDGQRLTDLPDGADRKQVMDRLIESSFHQIFVAGLFHADPHPGNLLVDAESTLTFLDFGLVGRVTPEMRDVLESLLVAVIFGDAEAAARTLYRAGSADGRVQLRELAAEIQELLDRYSGTSLAEQDTSRIAVELVNLARRHRLKLPEEYAVLARTEVALDGIARELVPDWDMVEAVRPYATRLLSARMDPEQIGGELLRSALGASHLLKDLPGQLDQLLLDLERGNFQLNAETPAVDRLATTLDQLGRSVVFGIGASAYLVSASILVAVLVLGRDSGSLGLLGGMLVVALGASLLAAGGLLLGLTWQLFVRQRLRAIRWRRFLGFLPGFGRRGSRDGGSEAP
jgi:ubiquinone biosynthesis protein